MYIPVRRHVNINDRVLREFEENSSYSTRHVTRILGITRNMVHRITTERIASISLTYAATSFAR